MMAIDFQSSLLNAICQMDNELFSVWELESLRLVFSNDMYDKAFGKKATGENEFFSTARLIFRDKRDNIYLRQLVAELEIEGFVTHQTIFVKETGEDFVGKLNLVLFEHGQQKYILLRIIDIDEQAQLENLRKGIVTGADDYSNKPLTNMEQSNAMESMLKKKELRNFFYSGDINGVQEFMFNMGKSDALKNLWAGRNINNYKKKQVIYKEGNHPSKMYYVEKGKVKTFKTNEDGKELTIGLFNVGEFFGYVALLENSIYKETAEAMEETEIALIPREEFESLINNNSEVARMFIRLLAQNVIEKEEQLLSLAYNSLRKRVADALITLEKKYRKNDEVQFSIHISREDLAHIAGTATESLIRTLSDFKAEKLIDIKDGNIIILNEKKLMLMIN